LPGSGNVAAVAAEVQRLQAMTEDPDAAHLGLGAELRALALITVGITELWAAHLAALSHAGTLRLTVPSHPAQVPDAKPLTADIDGEPPLAQNTPICTGTRPLELDPQGARNGGYLKSSADNAW
jgi:hypothetical protein